MKRYTLTALILLLALAAYWAGLSGAVPVLIGVAVALELWFWVRVLGKR